MLEDVTAWKDKGSIFKFGSFDIFYFQEGQGENLLIIHGYPFNSFEWKSVIDDLKKSYRLTIIDLLGMGFSDKPENHNYTFQEHCEIINELLSFLNSKETHIFSHDLGVSIVQELLARDLENKNKFTIKSSAFMNGGLFSDVYRPRLIQKLLSQSPTFIGKFLSRIISKENVFKSVSQVFGPTTQPNNDFMEKQWEILNFKDGKNIAYLIGRMVFAKKHFQSRWIYGMQNTKIPICYICGPADPNSGNHMAERYKELIPNPLIFLLGEQIGHWPQVEDPKGTLSAYETFIKRIS